MSGPETQLDWVQDYQRLKWYFIDPRDGSRVYQDGERIPQRSAGSTPRSLVQAAPMQMVSSQAQSRTRRSYAAVTSKPVTTVGRTTGGQQSLAPNQGMPIRALGNLQISSATSHSTPQLVQVSIPGAVTPAITQQNGVRVVEARDPTNGVVTRIGTGPPERITDPVLYQQGVEANRAIYGGAPLLDPSSSLSSRSKTAHFTT
ncbi:hypothetical protein LTR17_003573 [Elasticomyces elasticus]|nr:hypothetical protein LTR17_003573 [Elasticomyces elasticus]